MKTPFFGVSYVSRSRDVASDELINLYPEVVDTKNGKDVGSFYMAPGLDLKSTVGSGPHRGSILMAGVLYVVSGNQFFSVSSAWVPTLIGTVGFLTTPVSMITNGAQIAIFDGAAGWAYSGGTITQINLPFTNPVIGSYQDGFGLANEAGTNVWWQSNLYDLTTWQALNFTSADAKPDNVIALGDIRREVWVLKENDTEVWVDGGSSGFAFQRLQGVFIESGIAAPYSLAKAGDVLCWVSKNEEGQGIVVFNDGYQLVRVSTHALERRIQGYSTIADAIGFAYQDEGHMFYVLTFPTGNETWVYDFTVSRMLGVPAWHRRASFLNGMWNRHWAQTHAFAYGKHVIGDYQSGNLYAFNLNTALDNGQQRRWLRSWRALPQASEVPVRFSRLEIIMMTGINVPDGTDPQVKLRWSDDGGYNWRGTMYADAGKTGETSRRVGFNRLGATKKNTGLDRTFELSSSDAFGVALIGANLT